MLCTAELDMANTVATSDMDAFLTVAAWSICCTYRTVLKASPGAAIFGRDMLFDIPFLADWNKIGELFYLTKVFSTIITLLLHSWG